MPFLGQLLFAEIRPEFFRVLSGGNAPFFVDLLEAVELALETAPEGLPLDDAVALAKDIVDQRPFLASTNTVDRNDNHPADGNDGSSDTASSAADLSGPPTLRIFPFYETTSSRPR
jgi:hypothetical protein